MSGETIQPWERQPGETELTFSYFTRYRDLQPQERSIYAVARQVNRQPSTLSRACARWQWVQRSLMHDVHLDALRRGENEKSLIEMSARHTKIAMAIQAKIIERLQQISPAEIETKDLARLLEVAVKIERLGRGAPTEHTQSDVRAQLNVRVEHEIERLLHDPEARVLLDRLAAREASLAVQPRGRAPEGEPGDMEAG